MREGIEHLFPAPWPLPFDTMPLASGPTTADFRECLAGVERLFGFAKDSVLVLVAQHVPELRAEPDGVAAGQPARSAAGDRPGGEARCRRTPKLRPHPGTGGHCAGLELLGSEVRRVISCGPALLDPPPS